MERNSHGFTLPELLAGLAAVALLAAVAVPAYTSAQAAAHASRARTALAETLRDAVRHSALASSEAVLCPSSPAGGCAGSADWSSGWFAFLDRNGNRRPDPGERTVLQVAPLSGGVRLLSTAGRTRLVFQPSGGNAGSNVTFTLCDARGPAKATSIVLANDGRLRGATPSAEAAMRCAAGS